MANKLKRGESGHIKKQIWARDNYICQYCGLNMKEDFELRATGKVKRYKLRITIDHKIPKSKGGDWSLGNLLTACRACNTKKADKTH